MASWRWRSKRAGSSGSTDTDVPSLLGYLKIPGLNRASYRDFAARSDKIGASLYAGVVADNLDDRQFVGSGIADAGAPAGHRIADDLIAVAAVKPVDDGRQNGFIEGKSQQHAANAFHIGHVFGESRRAVCRRQRMLEGELARSG